jgi:NADP-dependent 3-hydroxy acid dehydrogenase YdfG
LSTALRDSLGLMTDGTTTESALDHTRYGPWAVVTGGSEGIGATFAQLLAEAGLNLVLIARKPQPLEDTAAACRTLGVEVRTVRSPRRWRARVSPICRTARCG